MRVGILFLGLALTACATKRPTAGEVCAKLEAASVAKACKAPEPAGGLGAAAREVVWFELPSVPGERGQVLTFTKASDYEATVKAFDGAAVLAGRHRYGSEKALVFVQLNSGTPEATGQAAKKVVDGLP